MDGTPQSATGPEAEHASPATPLQGDAETWPTLPTETEIYILPDGRVVVADLPAELRELPARLGSMLEPPSP